MLFVTLSRALYTSLLLPFPFSPVFSFHELSWLRGARLLAPQEGVEAISLKELIVRALLHHPPTIYHEDLVCIPDSAQSVQWCVAARMISKAARGSGLV